MTGDERTEPGEVRAYVRRLLLTIGIGIVVMASAAVWAWQTYGKRLDTTAPLPPGSPPMRAPSTAGAP